MPPLTSTEPVDSISPLMVMPAVITAVSSSTGVLGATTGFGVTLTAGATSRTGSFTTSLVSIVTVSSTVFSCFAVAGAVSSGVPSTLFVTCSNKPSSFDNSDCTSISSSNVSVAVSSVSNSSAPGTRSLTASEKSSLKSLKNPIFIPPYIIVGY